MQRFGCSQRDALRVVRMSASTATKAGASADGSVVVAASLVHEGIKERALRP